MNLNPAPTLILKTKAFTLIELLVVVLIIGILAAIALPQYRLAVAKSHANQGLAVVRSMYNATQEYKLTKGEYPQSFSDLSIEFPIAAQACPIDNISLYDCITDGKYKYELWTSGPAVRVSTGGLNNNVVIAYYNEHGGNVKNGLACAATKDNDFAVKVCLALGGHTPSPSATWIYYRL